MFSKMNMKMNDNPFRNLKLKSTATKQLLNKISVSLKIGISSLTRDHICTAPAPTSNGFTEAVAAALMFFLRGDPLSTLLAMK